MMVWKGWEGYEPPTTKPRSPDVEPSRAADSAMGAVRATAGAEQPPARKPTTTRGLRPAGGDRGTRRGARRVIVTEDRQVVDHALAKNTGTRGLFFQSEREALTWVARLGQQDRGQIRGLRRQVKFALQCRNASGLTETVTSYAADFVFEEFTSMCDWRTVVEDVKPKGGLLEDLYLLKRKWMRAQYGIEIRETH